MSKQYYLIKQEGKQIEAFGDANKEEDFNFPTGVGMSRSVLVSSIACAMEAP